VSKRMSETPDMNDLISDVRENDRALRDGVWVEEFEMRDSGSRRIVGWIAVGMLSPVFLYVAWLVLLRFFVR